jgi:hypothetical protein
LLGAKKKEGEVKAYASTARLGVLALAASTALGIASAPRSADAALICNVVRDRLVQVSESAKQVDSCTVTDLARVVAPSMSFKVDVLEPGATSPDDVSDYFDITVLIPFHRAMISVTSDEEHPLTRRVGALVAGPEPAEGQFGSVDITPEVGGVVYRFTSDVPEPMSIGLFGIGLLGLGAVIRRNLHD